MFITRTVSRSESLVRTIFDRCDIGIDGDRPWDIQVRNEAFYRRVIRQGALGLGESYMDGWWDAEQIDAFICRLLRGDIGKAVRKNWRTQVFVLSQRLFNHQSRRRARRVGERHYDLGNDLFEAMLDRRMNYSCGYWREARTLDEAQEAKLDLICRKAGLQPGMRVLDIGCGWGGFAAYAAERYGVSVVGINNSKEQTDYGRERCADLPVEIRVQDYRDVKGHFDAIVSIGMFEHVGPKNYRRFMRIVHRCLADDGLFVLHTIGGNQPRQVPDLWLEKYIFPGAHIPAASQITSAYEELFVMEDWHNFGADYDRTLMAWFENFNDHWDRLRPRYGQDFYRMWKYYLLSCAGSFRARSNQLWQIVLSKKGVPGGYRSLR